MKVYLECPPRLGQGIHRVVRELKAHRPGGVEIVATREEADFIVHHVVGVQNFSDFAIHELIAEDAASYAVIQYCLKTTEVPDPLWWWGQVWQHATVVWSYYDLQLDLSAWDRFKQFYHAPLGVSTGFHHAPNHPTSYLVGTSGYVAETEYVDLWAEIVTALKAKHWHLGPLLECLNFHTILASPGITDAQLAGGWAQCRYVNGLRAVEGFELPAAEGLVCGARPVLFDRPEHRQWFGDHAIYVREDQPRDALYRQLMRKVLEHWDDRVTDAERVWAREQFDWARLCRGFWDRIVR